MTAVGLRPKATLLATAIIGGLLLAACGGDDDGAVALDPDTAAGRGQRIAQSAGCESCHGEGGRGGAGPAWAGLAGTEVALDDGRTVIADTDYLRRSITEPEADMVAGYTVIMPGNQLTDGEVDDVVAYIQALPARAE